MYKRQVINVTDAPSHEPADYGDSVPGTRSTQAAGAALQVIGARMIGIASGEGSREQMEAIAVRTGAVAWAPSGAVVRGPPVPAAPRPPGAAVS